MAEPAPIEVHKALADDTRYRLHRYLRLSGRPVSVRELAVRLSLHPNTVRPHLRRLEDAGLVASEVQRGSTSVGRPQTVFTAVDREGREGRDYRLLADILAGLLTGSRQRERAEELAREWGAYLVGRSVQKPGRPASLRAQPRGAAGGAGRCRVRAAVPSPQRQNGRDHVARVPVPRPAGGTPPARVRRPSRPARGHAGCFPAPDGARELRAHGRTVLGLPHGGSRRLKAATTYVPRQQPAYGD